MSYSVKPLPVIGLVLPLAPFAAQAQNALQPPQGGYPTLVPFGVNASSFRRAFGG